MPRQSKPYQLNLFSNRHEIKTVQTPQWQALPVEARQALTKLMIRLILDHVDGNHAAEPEDAGHDV